MGNSSRLEAGASMIGFVLVVNLLAAYITTSIATGQDASVSQTGSGAFGSCSSSNNVTTCSGVGKESFFQAVVGTTFTGFDGAPFIVNAVWSLVMTMVLSVGVLLCVTYFIPFLSK